MKSLTFKNLWWIHIIILLRIPNWALYIFLHSFPGSLSQSVLYLKYMKNFIDKIYILNHSTLSIFFTDPLIFVPPSFSNTSNQFIKSQLHPTPYNCHQTNSVRIFFIFPFCTIVAFHFPSPSTIQIGIIDRDPEILKNTKEGFKSIECYIWYINNTKYFIDKICT